MLDSIYNLLLVEADKVVKEELEIHRELGVDIEVQDFDFSTGEFDFAVTTYDIDDPLNESGVAHKTRTYDFAVDYRNGYTVHITETT